jgi:two-component system, OmpR family, sensor histidine kinase BaeS
MRSLVIKLTLAFLLVGLSGSALVAILVQQNTQTAFNQFIIDQGQQSMVNTLEQYYQTKGSWQGVGDALQLQSPGQPPPGQGGRNSPSGIPNYTLIGADQTVILGDQPSQIGTHYSGGNLNKAVVLKVNGQTVGWLVPDVHPGQFLSNTPEGAFLQRVNQATLLSAMVAAAIALLLGGLLAYTLTRSISELKEATEDITRGNLGRQVNIRSKDELGDLAVSFNKMSTDLANATQVRRQMTADIAHDLRTPLSVLAGYTEALSDGKLPGNAEVYGILYQETQHLRRMVDDLRTLSLADAGELSLNLQPVQPQALLDQAAARHAVSAQQKGIAITVQPGQDLPEVEADPERMAQVFDNLIGNALRHTPAGGEITLSGAFIGGLVELRVKDNGSGIAPQDLLNIFDRFYRGDKSRQQNGESGLGLAISKSIVEVHHGSIVVESQPNQGAVFTIRLPAAKSHTIP